MMRLGICIWLLTLSLGLSAQLSGYGLIDGLYGFHVDLVKNETEYLEGTITYDTEDEARILVAHLLADTLRLQEMDEFLNPVTSVFAIRQGNSFVGQWHDIERNHQLPVSFYPGQSSAEMEYYAQRFNIQAAEDSNTMLFSLALSPTVILGKLIPAHTNEVQSFSGNTVFGTTMYYSQQGPINVSENYEVVEQLTQNNLIYFEKSFSLEALIPNFSKTFTDHLSDQLTTWKRALLTEKEWTSATRFPVRCYAICDIDYWNDEWVSGSFEYIGPKGSIDGFTFVFDRRADQFIEFDELMKSGDYDALLADVKEGELGISFDYYGLVYKGKFDPIHSRNSRHMAWDMLDFKIKRKLNEIHN